MTLDQFAQSKCSIPLPCFHCISTQIHLPNSLPSLHSLPLYSLNSSISVDTVLVKKSVYSQLADISPSVGPEKKALLLTPCMAVQEKNEIFNCEICDLHFFFPFPHSFLGNPLFFVTPFVLYFFLLLFVCSCKLY